MAGMIHEAEKYCFQKWGQPEPPTVGEGAAIPSPIRIGAHDYVVKRYDRTLDSDPLGRCNYVKAEILIAEGFAPTQEVDIVLHEILHGITDSAGVGHDGSEQVSWEQAITTIASGLAQVMRDNPDLVRWAMRRLGAE